MINIRKLAADEVVKHFKETSEVQAHMITLLENFGGLVLHTYLQMLSAALATDSADGDQNRATDPAYVTSGMEDKEGREIMLDPGKVSDNAHDGEVLEFFRVKD